jgi:hypothetical protein
MSTRFPARLLILIFVALMSLLGAAPASACTWCNCRRWNDYLPDQNGGGCPDSACTYICTGPAGAAAWNPRSPGFLSVPQNGEQVVDVVYPNSPAERAGLKPGDTLVSIDRD